MRQYIILALLSTFLSSCSAQAIEGLYQRKFESLDLKSDSTYSYVYRVEWVKAKSEGHWKSIGKNTVLINSQYNINSLPIKVIEKSEGLEGSCIFKIIPEGIDSSLIKNLEYELVLNDQSYERQKRKDIKIQIPAGITSMKVKVYIDKNILSFPPRDNVSTETYKVQTSQSNNFEIHFPLNIDMFYYENISNDTLKIKGDKLYWASKGVPPYKKMKK